jgi:two-component system OmpR family response regulator/two-component system response regulator QseB
MRLLLVEDDQHLGYGLKKGLERAGYSVEWLQDGKDGLHSAQAGGFEVAVLDVNLPGMGGVDVMRHIRADSKIHSLPTLMLTALDGVDNKVKGLDAGADDYLTKPFDFKELLARLRALIRRQSGQSGELLVCGDIELNRSGRTVKKAGEPLLLTARELRLLTLLMERKGHIINKSEIEEELYGWEEGADSNTVEVVIYNLRKKLGKDAISTIRGVGYRMGK